MFLVLRKYLSYIAVKELKGLSLHFIFGETSNADRIVLVGEQLVYFDLDKLSVPLLGIENKYDAQISPCLAPP